MEPGLWNRAYRAELLQSLLTRPTGQGHSHQRGPFDELFYPVFRCGCSIYTDQCKYHYMIRRGSAATSRPQGYRLFEIRGSWSGCTRTRWEMIAFTGRRWSGMFGYLRETAHKINSRKSPHRLEKKLLTPCGRAGQAPGKAALHGVREALYARPLYHMVRKAWIRRQVRLYKYDV